MKYRLLVSSEKIKEGDQYMEFKKSPWVPVIPNAIGQPLYSSNVGRFRRPITGNKSNAAQRAIKRGNKKTGRA